MPALNTQGLQEILDAVLDWLQSNVFILDHLIQFSVLMLLWLLSFFVVRRLKPVIETSLSKSFQTNRFLRRFRDTLLGQFLSLNMLIVTWIAHLVYVQIHGPALLLALVETLLLVWIVIKLSSSLIQEKFWARAFSITAWIVAALSILDVLEPMMEFLDDLGFNIGEVHLSVLSLIKAGILLFVSLQLGGWLNTYLSKQHHRVPQLTPSARVLINKTVGGVIYFVIAMVVLNSIGIDFTALAVFGGALGVGIGFGLQKVVSNLISGIILLSDRSIKPGDVVQIGDVYGWISSLKGRYVSVVTRDGHEYLIPNEDLITQQVINWSYSDTKVRLKIPFGISYNADPHEVRRLVLEAMNDIPRILSEPPPVCLLNGFGESSVDLELRLWIDDPKNGIGNIKSDILFKVCDTLKANHVEIPFPQRDVHIRSTVEKQPPPDSGIEP